MQFQAIEAEIFFSQKLCKSNVAAFSSELSKQKLNWYYFIFKKYFV